MAAVTTLSSSASAVRAPAAVRGAASRKPLAFASAARPAASLRAASAQFAGASLKTVSYAAPRLARSSLVVEAKKNKHIVGSLNGKGLRIGVVVGRFNDLVTKLLLSGAEECFERHGVEDSDVDICWVPGSFELPVVAKGMAESGEYDAVMAIGAVVRGSTTHYEAVAGAADSGLLNAGLSTGVPVIFGVLTTETMEQALDRAGGKAGNKGYECACTVVEMANLMKQLRAAGKASPPSFKK